jgi:hypothetical protein
LNIFREGDFGWVGGVARHFIPQFSDELSIPIIPIDKEPITRSLPDREFSSLIRRGLFKVLVGKLLYSTDGE